MLVLSVFYIKISTKLATLEIRLDFFTREFMFMLLYRAAGRLQDVCLSRI